MNKNVKTSVGTFNGENFSFDYCTSLSAEQKMQFVGEFSSLVITNDDYYKIVADMMFDFMIIRVFTNIDTSFIEEDDYADKISTIEMLVNETNIIETIMADIDDGIIEELRESCELNIEYKTGIHRNLVDEALSNFIKSLENIVSDIDMSDMMKIGKMLAEMQGEFTPEKMIDAFAKTDIYKNNRMSVPFSSTLNAPEYEA